MGQNLRVRVKRAALKRRIKRLKATAAEARKKRASGKTA